MHPLYFQPKERPKRTFPFPGPNSQIDDPNLSEGDQEMINRQLTTTNFIHTNMDTNLTRLLNMPNCGDRHKIRQFHLPTKPGFEFYVRQYVGKQIQPLLRKYDFSDADDPSLRDAVVDVKCPVVWYCMADPDLGTEWMMLLSGAYLLAPYQRPIMSFTEIKDLPDYSPAGLKSVHSIPRFQNAHLLYLPSGIYYYCNNPREVLYLPEGYLRLRRKNDFPDVIIDEMRVWANMHAGTYEWKRACNELAMLEDDNPEFSTSADWIWDHMPNVTRMAPNIQIKAYTMFPEGLFYPIGNRPPHNPPEKYKFYRTPALMVFFPPPPPPTKYVLEPKKEPFIVNLYELPGYYIMQNSYSMHLGVFYELPRGFYIPNERRREKLELVKPKDLNTPTNLFQTPSELAKEAFPM